MMLSDLDKTHAEGLADLTRAICDWALDHAWDRIEAEACDHLGVDPAILSDVVEDVIREEASDAVGLVLLRACYLADWNAIAAWVQETLDLDQAEVEADQAA